MKKIQILLLLSFFIFVGCSTMEGFGKDLQKLGDTIEDKAKK